MTIPKHKAQKVKNMLIASFACLLLFSFCKQAKADELSDVNAKIIAAEEAIVRFNMETQGVVASTIQELAEMNAKLQQLQAEYTKWLFYRMHNWPNSPEVLSALSENPWERRKEIAKRLKAEDDLAEELGGIRMRPTKPTRLQAVRNFRRRSKLTFAGMG
jgi:hypothetical protein